MANRRGLLLCAVAAVLFGGSTPAASRLADHLPGFVLAGFLYLGAAVAVLPFAARRRSRVAPAVVRAAVPRLALAVVFGGALGPVLLAVGLRDVPSATVSLLLNLELVFTALLAFVVFHEHLGRWLVAGTALVVGASVTLGWSGAGSFRTGALAVVAACLCWSIDNTVTANLTTLAPAHITLTKGVVAGSANLAIGLATSGGSVPWRYAVAALAVGAVGYGASITLWVAGAREIGAARGQLVFAFAPFVGAVAAWTVWRDPVQGRQVLALSVAVAGVALVLRSGHEHGHVHGFVLHDHEHDHADGHHGHDGSGLGARHRHEHAHEPVEHVHDHMPDVHHRHEHEG